VLFYSCGSKNNATPLRISVAGDSTVKFSGLDLLAVDELVHDSASTSSWQSLIPVYRLPADTDLKDYQPMQPGKYTVQDSLVIFTPDTPLKKGQAYFVRYYHYDKGSSLWDHIKDHQKLSSQQYTDLIFKQ
jgi:hypothetical protein